MITSFKVGNFKAFGETQEIPLKPITLIFGPNSSGKSSVIHSLLFGRHAVLRDEVDVTYPDGGGHVVDLGGFAQFVFGGRRGLERVVTWGAVADSVSLADRLDQPIVQAAEMLGVHSERVWSQALKDTASISIELAIRRPTERDGDSTGRLKPFVYSISLKADQLYVLGASRSAFDQPFRIDQFVQEHPLFSYLIRNTILANTYKAEISDSEYDEVLKCFEEVLPDFRIEADSFIPKHVYAIDRNDSANEDLVVDRTIDVIRSHLPKQLSDLFCAIRHEVSKDLSDLTYLGPLRAYPPRHLAFSEQDDLDWYVGGGHAWSILRDNPKVRKSVNKWLESPERLQTPYRLDVVGLFRPSSLFDDIEKGVNEVITNQIAMLRKYLSSSINLEAARQKSDYEMLVDGATQEIADVETLTPILENAIVRAVSADALELVLTDKRTNTEVSHRDVGIGISQVLPVLVNAYAHHNRIIAMEQPEIHLHPALQAELADVFIECALGDQQNRFILETHSEHLILRILRRIREAGEQTGRKISPDDVAVLYVLPTDEGSCIKRLDISDAGQFLDGWPGGFFPERVKEIFGG